MAIILIDKHGKKTFVKRKGDVNTQYGVIKSKDINKCVGKARVVKTHKGYEFLVVKPSLLEKVENLRMGARPIYPYDAGVITALLSITSGSRVLEAGTGSGGMTLFLAELGARVFSYEAKEEFFEKAKENLSEYKNVKLFNKDVKEAKHKKESFDAVFLDLKSPASVISIVKPFLKKGGFMGAYSPIMDDIKPVWRKLEEEGFTDIRCLKLGFEEVIVKKYARVKGLMGFPGFFIWARRIE